MILELRSWGWLHFIRACSCLVVYKEAFHIIKYRLDSQNSYNSKDFKIGMIVAI